MENNRFAVTQTVAVLNDAASGLPVADLICRIGISEHILYHLQKQYAGLNRNSFRQFKLLQQESECSRRNVGELRVDKPMLPDVMMDYG